MDEWGDFPVNGFAGVTIQNLVSELRSQNAEWFGLAADTNRALVVMAADIAPLSRKSTWSKESVGLRVFLRACGAFQAALLLAERGMVAESRTLTRGLVEACLCLAALVRDPDEVIEMLKEDHEASRRNQMRFIVVQKLGSDEEARDQFAALVEEIGKKPAIMSVKKLAEVGRLLPQYLTYQRLSDDAAHTTARSLHRYLVLNDDGAPMDYQVAAGSPEEGAATLSLAVATALLMAVQLSALTESESHAAALEELTRRFEMMPDHPII